MFKSARTIGDIVPTMHPEQLEELLLYIQLHTGIDIHALLQAPAYRLRCLRCVHFHPISLSCLNSDIVEFDPRICECQEVIKNEPNKVCDDCALYDRYHSMCCHETNERNAYHEPDCEACIYFNERG